MDIGEIQKNLLDAMEEQRKAQLDTLNTQRNLMNQKINVGANASGTLFSSAPIFQQAQFVNDKYLPAVNKVNVGYAKNQVKINNTVADALKKIKAMNDAAAELNGA